MTTKVGKKGLLIPKELLKDMDEVEIKWERDHISIYPVNEKSTKKVPRVKEDPIWKLGSNPGRSGLKDASIHHDKYIYEEK